MNDVNQPTTTFPGEVITGYTTMFGYFMRHLRSIPQQFGDVLHGPVNAISDLIPFGYATIITRER
jgi:hypothetical protein